MTNPRSALIVLLLVGAVSLRAQPPSTSLEKACVAGGCFWCMESDFEGLPGVEDVVSGFTGGTANSPWCK